MKESPKDTVRMLVRGFSKLKCTALLPGASSHQILDQMKGPPDPTCIQITTQGHLLLSEMQNHLL